MKKRILPITYNPSPITSRSGFSIFELVIVMAIFTGIVLVTASFRANLGSLENVLNQRLQSRQDIEQSFQIMSTEIRSAQESSLGAYPIDAAASSSLTFFSDIDKDGLVERVRYFRSTSTIRKGILKPSGDPLSYPIASETISTVVNNVVTASTTPLFLYYDNSYTGSQAQLSSPVDVSKIHVIQISLYADIKASSTPKPEFFTNTITIRNLRNN